MKRIGIVVILLFSCIISFAQVSEAKYYGYTDKISKGLQADVNNTKSIKKAVNEILTYGDLEQCYWLGTTLVRINAFGLKTKSLPVYREWAERLVLRLISLDADFQKLADGRKPTYLFAPYFYTTYSADWQLAELLSLINDICGNLNVKKQVSGDPSLSPIINEQWSVKSHYFEYTLYGNDSYACREISPGLDSLTLYTIAQAVGDVRFFKTPYMLPTLIAQLSDFRKRQLLPLHKEVVMYGQYYLSSLDASACASEFSKVAQLEGNAAQITNTISRNTIEVLGLLYPTMVKNAGGYLASIHAETSENVEWILSFIQYRQQLLDQGKDYANYPPNQCPIELMEDESFETYKDMYARFGFAMCREIGKFHTVSYLNGSGESLRAILSTVGYGNEKEDWIIRFGLYLSNLLELTQNIYYETHASWTIGAIVLETKVLRDLLNICTIDAVYYGLMLAIPFFVNELGNEEFAKNIMEAHMFNVLPYVNLRSRDKDLNCFYMDFYTKVIQFLSLYDEPRRSELAQTYVKPFEQALAYNRCDWRNEHIEALLTYYFDEKDTIKLHQYLDEYLALSGDTMFVDAYQYLIDGAMKGDFAAAARCLDRMNRTDSAMAASYASYSGLNPAYVYARNQEKEKAMQQLRVFDTFLGQQFALQLMTVGDDQASQLLKRYEGVNDFFVQAYNELDSTDIKAQFMREFYNWQLFSKGLLLALNKETDKLLSNHPSESVRRLHKQLLTLEAQYSTITNRETLQADMVHSNIDAVRNNLQNAVRAYMDQNPVVTINMTNWTDVRDALHPHEAALEIVSGKLENDSIPIYYAMLLRHDDETPAVIELFKEPELLQLLDRNKDSTHINDTYQYHRKGKRMTQLIWEHVLPYIEPGDTVYFSPSGVLHLIAMESLPYDESRTMSEVYHLKRVSSTREVALEKPVISHTYATLYGGIQYNVDMDELLAASVPYRGLEVSSMANDTIDRGRASYLPGTEKEVAQIQQTLADKDILVQTYSSTAANEESFKALSGKNQNIIHLATHGFYWSAEDAKKLTTMNQYTAQYFLNPLNRCGLLFAGANTALSGHSDRLPQGVQDGILTAQEISLLDFSQADIVVLSACETGMGDVTSEGVFGLQRAFKKAGAQTIMTALWKVNDEATRMLMTAFYRNYSQGQTKREALQNAQKEVRDYTRTEEKVVTRYIHPSSTGGTKKEDMQNRRKSSSDEPIVETTTQTVTTQPYQSPYYWAGFILLD